MDFKFYLFRLNIKTRLFIIKKKNKYESNEVVRERRTDPEMIPQVFGCSSQVTRDSMS